MTSTFRYGIVRLAFLLVALATVRLPITPWLVSVGAHDEEKGAGHDFGYGGGGTGGVVNAPPLGRTPCVAGLASVYPCARVDLESFVPLGAMGGGKGNDIWGWTDQLTGKEYAIVGRTSGTSFVDVSDPSHPIYLGNLPTHNVSSTWRSIKVYADHALISSEAADHGLQVFDLTQLRAVSSPPVSFTETAHYAGFGRTHTLAINEATGFLYATGSNTCSGGLHAVDVRVPDVPTFAGCFSADGYSHETQCVVYAGPDAAYPGRELCFSSNEDTLTIVDVTDKGAPVMLSRTKYSGRGYTHQGWLTDDHRYFLLDDEKDETLLKTTSRTYVWDLADLHKPIVLGIHQGTTMAIDHNLYIRGSHAFETNYTSGLRVLDISRIATATLREIGFFDVHPEDDLPEYSGSWTNYPFFASGIVIVNTIDRGLFVVRPNLNPIAGADLVVSSLSSPTLAAAGGTLTITDTTTNQGGSSTAPSSRTNFSLSTDPLPGGDIALGGRSIGQLAGAASSSATTTLPIPGTTAAGKYYLLGVADANGGTAEEIENNNSRPQIVNVGPDLVITKITGPTLVTRGSTVTVSGTTKNNGVETSTPVVTRLYLSVDGNLGNVDVEVGSYLVPSLGPGEVNQTSAVVSIPSNTVPRVYYLIGHVDRDGTLPEYNETNNANKYRLTVQ